MLRVRPATASDAISVARRLRDADRREVLAASGRAPEDSLLAGVEAGPTFVWTVDETPCVLFGVVPHDRTGFVWLVGTPEMETHKAPLLRHSRPWVDSFNARWPLLVNTADARNTLHHKFIRWLGFTFFATRRLNGLLFLDFARIHTGGSHL